MKQRDFITVFIGLSVALSIFVIRPFFYHKQAPYEIPQYYKIHEENDESWPEKIINDPVALFTLVLTIFTGGLYLATRSLWTSTEKLVIGAEKTSAMQLRAYVGIKSVVLNGSDAVQISVQNFGRTPASQYFVDWLWFDNERSVDPFRDDPTGNVPNRSTLMPNAIDDIIQDVGIPRRPMQSVVAGRITYIDVFNVSRFTNFRLVTDRSGTHFIYDTFGNETDDD